MARDGEPFACFACYDATTARWLERAGVHVLLMGDSAAEIVLGHKSTIHMPLEVSIALTAGLKRGAPNTVVMADMPFMSYHADEAEAINAAGRYMTEGMADIVKLEADASFAPIVAKMTRAGVPICGHVGSRPQQVGLHGGYVASGRTAADASRIVSDARALEEAGAVMLLVEAVPHEVAERIIAATDIPLIGIGAGPACHGQILVLQDLLGLTDWQPGFAQPMLQMGEAIRDAARDWVDRVRRRAASDHRYVMKPGESGKVMV